MTVLSLRPFTAVVALLVATLTLVRPLIAAAKAVTVAAIAVATFRPGHLLPALWRCRRLGTGRSGIVALEPTEDAIDDTRMPFGRTRRLGFRLLRAHRRRSLRRDALHGGLLARRARFLRRRFLCFFFDRRGDEVVARGQCIGLIQIVVTKAFDLVVGSLKIRVRDQHHVDLQPRFDRMDVGALFVEQERGDVHRHLGVHGGAVFLHRFFLDDPQDMQCGGFGTADVTGAVAARAGDVAAFAERRAKALARQLHQAETRDLAHLHPRAVVAQRVAQASLHFALVVLVLHVDEIDDDEAAKVAQPQLPGDLVGRLGVGVVRGLLDVVAARGARRIDVDRDERFGVVDHHRAAGRERHLARVGGLDLMLDLEAREQRHVVAVTLHPLHVVGHDVAHERHRLLEDRIGVDQDLADVGLEVIADGANDEAAFLVDEERRRVEQLAVRIAHGLGRLDDLAPELEQIAQVPLQLFVGAADAGGAADNAHPGRNVELVHDLAQLVAILTLHAARHAAAARIVRHQYEVASGETDEGGERRALVAALVLFDLDDQILAFGKRVLDARAADIDAGPEKLARDLLKGKKSVALGAVVHKRGFEAGLDPGDDTLVDVAFSLFLGGRFDVEVYQFLAFDDRDTEFLGLCRIEKHALHCSILPRARAGQTKSLIVKAGLASSILGS